MNQHKIFFVIITFFVSTQVSYGQKTEINLDVYSGSFSFTGKGATPNSFLVSSPFGSPTTSNPYGTKSGFSYAFEVQAQRITKRKNIYGIGISLEELTSKVNITGMVLSGVDVSNALTAKGKTELKNTFLTFNPFVGHRYSYNKVTFDLLTGLDLAFCLESNENGNATATGLDLTAKSNRPKPSIDFRPRIQVKAEINKFGFIAGYSSGLTNYQNGNNPKAYSSFLRLGFSYLLK